MSEDPRFRKRMFTSAVALGLAVGSVGVAVAATGVTSDSPPTIGEATEAQDPVYPASIQAPVEDESLSEADEATQLEQLATISAQEAVAAAAAAVPGDVGKVELDNENGAVVYSVEITDTAGGETDVKVDAGDGTVLDQQADDEADGEAGEVDNDDVEDENEHGGHSGNEAEDIRDD